MRYIGWVVRRAIVGVGCLGVSCLGFSQWALASSSYWQNIDITALQRSNQTLMVKTSEGRQLFGDTDVLRQQLLNNDRVDIELPLPNGETAIYHFEHSPIAEQGLLEKFPEIKTFRGVDTDNATNIGRFDISPAGFRGMFRHDGKTIFIDPQYRNNTRIYTSYYSHNALRMVPPSAEKLILKTSTDTGSSSQVLARGSSDGTLRIYRLAVAATGEYTSSFGGTVSGAMAGIITAINRVNQVFEADFGIRLQLVANNNNIVYTDPLTDPYGFNSSNNVAINQTTIDSVIGSDNYDIGHLFTFNGGGLVVRPGNDASGFSVGSVCNSDYKAHGLTGTRELESDVFYIDFLAHEIGHQFSADHTYNGTAGFCGADDQRIANAAFEPGSGSTIMGYADTCGVQDLQSNSDAYFHAYSIQQVTRFVQSVDGFCGTTVVNSSNSVPEVSAGLDMTIPANTPFMLSGSATDPDVDDVLTYNWEQFDAGAASSNVSEMVDDGTRALFRSFEPTRSGTRYLPRLQHVLQGPSICDPYPCGESYPTTDRELNFRLTVRDAEGGTAYDDRVITVEDDAGPFQVTSPAGGTTWTVGTETVTWNVADTDSAPVSCSAVDITLSSDNDGNFAYDLALNTPNDGSQTVDVPLINTDNARIMVACADNIFFAVNTGAFEVSAVALSVTNITESTAVEGGQLTFNIALSALVSSATDYSFKLFNQTVSNADLGSISFSNGVIDNGDGTLTVPLTSPEISSFSMRINTVSDAFVEGDETLVLYLGGRSATGTLSDNNIRIEEVTDAVAAEGDTLLFTVSLNATTSSPVSGIAFSLDEVAPISDADYGAISFFEGDSDTPINVTLNADQDEITIPSGVLSFDVSVATVQDTEAEPTETLTLTIGGESATGSIADDDSPGGVLQRGTRRGSGGGGGFASPLLLGLLLLMAMIRRERKYNA